MRVTACEALILRLLIRSAKAIPDSSPERLGSSRSSWYSAAIAEREARIAWSSACTSASRRADGGVVPGFFRASPRTEAAARSTALVAMPVHTAPHRRCETGTMVSAPMSAKGTGRICSTEATPSTSPPAEQVPRIPSASQVPSCFSW